MTITDLVHVAEAIHNAEGWDLGKSSNREYRNAFWARVIGVVHHGHPLYNPAPDSRWLLKREPNGPQSDDVAAFAPTREAWDCIPGAGANGYRFEARYLGVLAPHQVIYAPPMPEEYGPVDPPDPPPIPPPTMPTYEDLGGDTYWRTAIGVPLQADMAMANQTMNDGSAVWLARPIFRILAAYAKGETPDHLAIIKSVRNEWRAILGFPPVP